MRCQFAVLHQLLMQVVQVRRRQQLLPLWLPLSNPFLDVDTNVFGVKNQREKLVNPPFEKFIISGKFTFKLAKDPEQINETIVTNQWLP